MSTAVELGHRIGNQHWDVAVDGATLYIPVEADRAIIEDVLSPYIPDRATTRYETVDAERFINSGDDTAAGGHDVDYGHTGEQGHDNHDHDHDHTEPATATVSEGETR